MPVPQWRATQLSTESGGPTLGKKSQWETLTVECLCTKSERWAAPSLSSLFSRNYRSISCNVASEQLCFVPEWIIARYNGVLSILLVNMYEDNHPFVCLFVCLFPRAANRGAAERRVDPLRSHAGGDQREPGRRRGAGGPAAGRVRGGASGGQEV